MNVRYKLVNESNAGLNTGLSCSIYLTISHRDDRKLDAEQVKLWTRVLALLSIRFPRHLQIYEHQIEAFGWSNLLVGHNRLDSVRQRAQLCVRSTITAPHVSMTALFYEHEIWFYLNQHENNDSCAFGTVYHMLVIVAIKRGNVFVAWKRRKLASPRPSRSFLRAVYGSFLWPLLGTEICPQPGFMINTFRFYFLCSVTDWEDKSFKEAKTIAEPRTCEWFILPRHSGNILRARLNTWETYVVVGCLLTLPRCKHTVTPSPSPLSLTHTH